MAMQTGLSVSKILVLAGAGYTGTILLKNGKLSDLLGDLQAVVKGMEKSGDESGGDTDHADAVAAQVRRLAMEVRQLASARQITVLNGSSGQIVNLSSLIVPAAALGAVGYGYMWWKGLSLSDFMYVTKRSMTNAVSNLTKHLESVTEALSAAKRHLSQRMERLDDKMDLQNKLSKKIKGNVEEAQKSLSGIEYSLEELQNMVSRVGGRICSLEEKQNIANYGVLYLCNFVEGKKLPMPDDVQEQLLLSGNSRGLLINAETPNRMGLKDLADVFSGSINQPADNPSVQDFSGIVDDRPRTLSRTVSKRS